MRRTTPGEETFRKIKGWIDGILCHERSGATLKAFSGSWLARACIIAKGICHPTAGSAL